MVPNNELSKIHEFPFCWGRAETVSCWRVNWFQEMEQLEGELSQSPERWQVTLERVKVSIKDDLKQEGNVSLSFKNQPSDVGLSLWQ